MARNCEPGTRFCSNLNYSILKLDPHSNKFRRKSPESQISPGLAIFGPYLQNTQKPRCTFVEEMRNSTVFPANEITRCQSLPATVSVPLPFSRSKFRTHEYHQDMVDGPDPG